MNCRQFLSSKVMLGSFNFVFLICGLLFLVLGFLLLCDTSRILLSRLLTLPDHEAPQPPFYYAALAIIGAGLFMGSAGAIGCWATYARGYCILTFYFLMILIILVAQCAACVMVVAWPGCLGLDGARGGAVGVLQTTYGVPGHEQFTAAMDLAQTMFECCGMTDGRNYDMSMWQLRRLGPRDLIVPLTCCVPTLDSYSYLDPKPANESICQELLPEHFIPYRYEQGCLSKVEIWYQKHYIVFLIIVFILCLVEFGVLFSVILVCVKMRKKRKETRSFIIKPLNNKNQENIYHNKMYSIERPVTDPYIQPDTFYSPSAKKPSMPSSHYYNTRRDEMA